MKIPEYVLNFITELCCEVIGEELEIRSTDLASIIADCITIIKSYEKSEK